MKNPISIPVAFILFLLPFSHSSFSQTTSSLQQARKEYQEDNYAEAIKLLEKAAIEEPQNAQVPYLTGRAYMDMNNYKKAASFLKKAIAMDSTRGNWLYECGLIYYAIPDYKKSLEFIRLAGDKGYKKTNDYLENLGNAYINVGQHEKGLEILNEVLKKKPEDPELLYQVAQANFKSGKYQDAIDLWDRVLEQDKTNAEALYMIGLSYQKKGEKEKGQQLCDRAIQMDPSLRTKRQQMGGGGL
jgi:tetratricopeptide (TPR) repeat protein